MIALTGNIDVKGGNVFASYPDGFVPALNLWGFPEFRPSREIKERRIGAKEFPFISGPDAPVPFVHPHLGLEAILTEKPYPIKGLYSTSNFVVSVQNSKRIWKAIKRLDFLVVADFWMTPTAELADIVLPAATWLERDEVCDLSYTNYLTAGQKAIEPLYECWDDMKMIIELVKRIPWADRRFCPWNSVEE